MSRRCSIRCIPVLLLVCGLVSSVSLAGDLQVREAWLRALPPGQPTTAVYLVVENQGAQPVRLTGAVVPWADRAELHESRQVEGRWQMRRLEHLSVPAGRTVALQPGGAHLMVFGLRQVPRAGETLELTLEFAGGQTLSTTARVVAPGDGPPVTHH